jgi:uncharacterized membrane protein YgdD (TMEM256/DUF423 family)
MYSALGLMLISLLAKQIGGGKLVAAGGRLIFAGSVIFSGSLYVLALSEFSKLGMITPIGGGCMLAGWLCIIIAALKAAK